MKNTTVIILSKTFVIIGIILIATAFYGSIFEISLPNKKSYSKLSLNSQKQIDQFSPQLWYQVKSLDDLHELANNQNFNLLTSQEKMDVLFNLVIQNFIHKEAKHTFLSNYMLFFFGANTRFIFTYT